MSGVQIVDGGRNGRHVLMWAASRIGMLRGMDAMCWSGRRLCGVQNWDGGRNGRQCGDEVASRLWMLGGMDAM